MATLTTALNTVFTPAVGDFVIQVTGGQASLLRRGTSGAAWVELSPDTLRGPVVSNPVAGVQYMFTSNQNVAVQADQ